MAVSAENGTAADVSVTLTSQPSSQKPTFTSGCTKGDKTATCTVSSVSDQKAVDLDAQIPVASSATSVSSVKLTATASIVTTAKWTPPASDATVTVTSASAAPAKSSAKALPESIIPLGPLPVLNGVSSSLIGAGNASGLFPAISPSPAASAVPSPSAAPHPQSTKRNAATAADSSALAPVLTAQIAGLVALAAAIALTMTRLSLRRRFRSRKQSR